MIDFKKYVPSLSNEPFYAITKYGKRIVKFNSLVGMWQYCDCTHPLQNMNCNPYDIDTWEYVDNTKMDGLYFVEGWIYKEQLRNDADAIIAKIKPTFLERIKSKFRRITNKA